MGHRVFGPVAGHRDAVALARRTRPALVLADVQLKGGENGIAAVQEILDLFATRVIFVTAYPEQLTAAPQIESAFLVLKPLTPSALKTTVGHALSTEASGVRPVWPGWFTTGTSCGIPAVNRRQRRPERMS